MERKQGGIGNAERQDVRARTAARRRHVARAALAAAWLALVAGGAAAAVQESEPNGRTAPQLVPAPAQDFVLAFPNGVVAIEGELGAGDVDFYAFELEAGQLLLVSLFDDQAGAFQDTRVGAFSEAAGDDTSSVVASNDDGGPGFLSRLAVPVSASGTWKVAVTGFRDTGFDGSHAEALQGALPYRLVVGVAQATPPLSEADVDATSPLPAGGAVVRGALDPAGVDAFPIVLGEGQLVTASLFDLKPGLLESPAGEFHDTLLGLRAPGGALVVAATNDDGGPGFLSNLAFEVPAGQGGLWTVLVTGFPDRSFAGSHIAGPFDYELVVASLGEIPRCDVNGDQSIDRTDVDAIFAARGQPASGPTDPRDLDADGTITILDARACVLRCDNTNCAPNPPPASAASCGLLGVEALLALVPALAMRRRRSRRDGPGDSMRSHARGEDSMMKRLLVLALGAGLATAAAAPAYALSLGFAPSTISAPAVGGSFDVDLVIAGLASGGPPSVGGFDVDVSFDPSRLAFTNATFGTLLGDPALFEAITSVLPSAGLVDLGEVSLLSPGALDALQPASFTLATLSFSVLAAGNSEITIANALVSSAGDASDPSVPPQPLLIDTLGSVAVVGAVPEPSAALAFALGLALVGSALRRAPVR